MNNILKFFLIIIVIIQIITITHFFLKKIKHINKREKAFYESIYKNILNSNVRLLVLKEDGYSYANGSLISNKGAILTCAHFFEETNSTTCTALIRHFNNYQRIEYKLEKIFKKNDVALLTPQDEISTTVSRLNISYDYSWVYEPIYVVSQRKIIVDENLSEFKDKDIFKEWYFFIIKTSFFALFNDYSAGIIKNFSGVSGSQIINYKGDLIGILKGDSSYSNKGLMGVLEGESIESSYHIPIILFSPLLTLKNEIDKYK